ncbi:MAG: XRE family transcriptional regulator [Deltaproteobacteria bacterium]|nr:MAG: XRE family transcriptional regulator [Deltaproteobacteria bacterium]
MEASANLAANLKWMRERRSLSQAQLAKLASVPRSTIANLEGGDANPTLAVLLAMAEALQVRVEELLSPPRARVVKIPASELPARPRARRGTATVKHLLPDPVAGLEIDRLELGPNALVVGIPHRPGTREYLCCERGRVRLTVLGEELVLDPGDVAVFPGDQKHSYANAGETTALTYSVVALAPLSS